MCTLFLIVNYAERCGRVTAIVNIKAKMATSLTSEFCRLHWMDSSRNLTKLFWLLYMTIQIVLMKAKSKGYSWIVIKRYNNIIEDNKIIEGVYIKRNRQRCLNLNEGIGVSMDMVEGREHCWGEWSLEYKMKVELCLQTVVYKQLFMNDCFYLKDEAARVIEISRKLKNF